MINRFTELAGLENDVMKTPRLCPRQDTGSQCQVFPIIFRVKIRRLQATTSSI